MDSKINSTKSQIVYSVVKDVNDNKPIKYKTSWNAFIQTFKKPVKRGQMPLKKYLACKKDPDRKHLADAQKNGTAMFPGEFNRPGTRIRDNIKSRTLLVLDLDDGNYTFEQLENKLKGIECIIHTTYSHSKETAKFRVLIPFDEPVTKDIDGTCSRALDYHEQLLGKHIDKKCWTVSMIYFTSSCPPDAGKYYRFKHLRGAPIKVSDYKLLKRIDQAQIDAASKPPDNRPGDDFNRRGNLSELLEKKGWRHFFTDRIGHLYMTRPGKRKGISAVIFNDSRVLYIFSSDSSVLPFEGGKAYSPFTVFTLINHDGDYAAAASQLRSEGYGVHGDIEEGSENQEDLAATSRASSTFPEVSFPLDVFPDYFQQGVDTHSKALQCSPAFMAANFMTIVSGAAGNVVTLEIKQSWQTAPHIWLGIIDVTGSGKSHPIDAAMKPLHKLQAVETVRFEKEVEENKKELSLYKKDKENNKPPTEPNQIRHYYSNNFTIESLIPMFKASPRGIVLHVDELAGLLKGLNQYKVGKGSDDEQFLSLFNCGPLKSDRKSGGGFCRESGAAVIGGIQPGIFSQVFSDKEHENGMVYRFLPMLIDALPPMFSEDDISEKEEVAWGRLIDWMYKIPAPIDPATGFIVKQRLIVEEEGMTVWKDFHDELSGVQLFMPKRFIGYIPKLKIYCLKFMAVLHLLKCYPKDNLSLIVKKSTVRGAVKLTRYFAGQALKLVIGVSKDQNPYRAVIRKALVSLQGEVKGGKLVLTRVRKKVNELLPEKMELEVNDNKQLATWLRDMGLEVTTGTGNKSVVLWNADIILS